ncbi:hypothetical protein PV327_006029 [Microctonus hyperodae]|uniref:Odorant receptor n=1 Tax=Microctonus hyperodae TaxID=165561 RepID=A0AA39L0D0_MICHY|nr:hypothetical protein PV327_006029 [Microctonus hyperodae]
MEETQIEAHHTVLTMSIAGLRFCGIWRLDSSASIYIKQLHFLSSVLGMTVVLLLITTIATDLVLNLNDLLIVTDNGCYLAGLSVILFKVYKFHIHHKRIQKLTEAIYKPFQNIQQSADPGVITILKSNTFYENLGELPIRAAYPFDTTISPMHEFAAVTQMYAVAYGLVAILLMDTVGLGFMRWINVQLIILTSNYQNCTSQYQNKNHFNTSGSTSEIESDMAPWIAMGSNRDLTEISTFVPFMDNEFDVRNNFIERFKKCVINHRRLIRIIDDINITFSASMLMQLFASFTMICLTGFQAVLGAKEKSNLMKFGIYLGAAFTQLLYWCWYGNELFYQKHSLLIAQWMSGWENQLNSTSKILIIMSMIRTMQPFELKAGSFFTMSMETFITVI